MNESEKAPEPTPSAPVEKMPQAFKDLLDTVAARFPVRERTENWLLLGWENPVLVVQVTCLFARGLIRVLITADVCAASEIKERAALELATKLLFGGLIIEREMLGLRHVFTDGRMTVTQVLEGIVHLRANALQLRERLLETQQAARQLYNDYGY